MSHSIDLEKLLSENDLKVTKQRILILKAFYTDKHPLSAEDVFVLLKKEGFDLATIYRTITSFETAGLVRKVDLRKGAQYYERTDSDHHHHITCKDCGKIEDFELCGIEDIATQTLKRSSFAKIDAHSLELFGTCKKCTK